MLIPNKNLNIYPKNKENIKAILDFYLPYPEDKIDWILDNKTFEVNQIEYIARKVSENIQFFQIEIPNGLTISNLMDYGINALGKSENEWKGTKGRLRISRAFREIISNDLERDF